MSKSQCPRGGSCGDPRLCLSAALEDLEDLYETAPCGYVSVSPEGMIVKANRTIADWLCHPHNDLPGKSIHDILSIGGRIAVETHLAPLLRMQGHVHEIALDLLTADGEKIPTIANAAEKRDSEGRHIFTRLTLFKAVDRRAYERSLLEARIKAETELKRSAKLLWFANSSSLFLDMTFATRSLRAPLAFAC